MSTVKNFLGGGESANIFITGLLQSDSVSCVSPSGRSVNPVWGSMPNPESHGLPEGYTELDSITSNGNGLLDVGIHPKQSVGFEIEVSMPSTSDGSICYLDVDGDSTGGFGVLCLSGSFKGRRRNTDEITFGTFSANQFHNIKFNDNGANYYDSVQVSSFSSTYSEKEYNLYLFGRNSSVSSGIVKTPQTIRKATYWDGNTIIKNLIPCKRNSDNVVSMYDLVSGTFLTPNGTFTAGAEVPSTIPCWNIPCKEYGTYSISATRGSTTISESVLVDVATDYTIPMSFNVLYEEGWDNEALTGGWKTNVLMANGWGTAVDAIFHDDYIEINPANGANQTKCASILTNNKIDFTGYTTLKVSCVQLTSDNNMEVMVTSINTNNFEASSVARCSYPNPPLALYTLDISSLTESNYVAVYGIRSKIAKVYKIWLE